MVFSLESPMTGPKESLFKQEWKDFTQRIDRFEDNKKGFYNSLKQKEKEFN